MPCETLHTPAGPVIACTPTHTRVQLQRMTCPVCGQHAELLAEYADWYGWDVTCLRCGAFLVDGDYLVGGPPKERARRAAAAAERARDYQRLHMIPPCLPMDGHHLLSAYNVKGE